MKKLAVIFTLLLAGNLLCALDDHVEPAGCPHLHTHLYELKPGQFIPMESSIDFYIRTYFTGHHCESVTEGLDALGRASTVLKDNYNRWFLQMNPLRKVPFINSYFSLGDSNAMKVRHLMPSLSEVPLLKDLPLVSVRFSDGVFLPRPGYLMSVDAANFFYSEHRNDMEKIIQYGSRYCPQQTLVCSKDGNPYGENSYYTGIIFPTNHTRYLPRTCDVTSNSRDLATAYCSSRNLGTPHFLPTPQTEYSEL